MATATLSRYFALRFLGAALAIFAGVFVLVVLLDYVEMARRASDLPNASPLDLAKISIYRVPQLTERVLPFSILIGAMLCYLNLSRRLELVVARSAGMSAWQFVMPAILVAFVLGVVATTVYNPISASLREHSKQLEAELFGSNKGQEQQPGGFWLRQRSSEGQAIINAASSRGQGVSLDGVTVFAFDEAGQFQVRIEAKTADLESGHWRLTGVRLYSVSAPPEQRDTYLLPTNLAAEQVRESFATPETVSFWQLPKYITAAEQAGLAASGYRLQYQVLLARPFFLASMVLLAASVSLRFFRFGGVLRMILSGITAGFLLYVFAKITEDVSKAELMHPVAAAWAPMLIGGLTGVVALLYQEDG